MISTSTARGFAAWHLRFTALCIRHFAFWRAVLAIVLLAAPALGHSQDTYDPATGILTIPLVVVGNQVYTNVTILVGSIVVQPQGGPAASTFDTYDPQTNQLTIASVRVGALTYTNVVITVARVLDPPPVNVVMAGSAPLLVLRNPLPDATVGQWFEQSVVGGIIPSSRYTYTMDTFANGVPPPGLILDLNGVLRGTPSGTGRTDGLGNQVANTYTFGVCATDTISRWTTSPCPTTTMTVRPAPFTLSGLINGRGTVDVSPPGPTYAPGTVVTLTASPETGHVFSGWSGACSGSGTCSLTMNADKYVVASFAPAPACSYTYSDWSACSGGQQTRSVTSATPAGCTGTPSILTQACSTASNACYYCRFDVYCTIFGAGGCWRCNTSSVVSGSCVAPSDALVFYGSTCRADPGLYQVCQ